MKLGDKAVVIRKSGAVILRNVDNVRQYLAR